jgi:hypothetical protein
LKAPIDLVASHHARLACRTDAEIDDLARPALAGLASVFVANRVPAAMSLAVLKITLRAHRASAAMQHQQPQGHGASVAPAVLNVPLFPVGNFMGRY